MSKVCIFCGGGQSKEHVIAQWLIRDAALRGELFTMGFGAMEGDVFNTVDEVVRIHQFTIQSVCQDCNNGWMSCLENSAKRLLSPLIGESWPESDLQFLNELSRDRFELTLYLLKTAVTFGEKMNEPLHEDLRRDVYRGVIPKGICVDLVCSEVSGSWFTLNKEWPILRGDACEPQKTTKSFRFTWQIRHLILRIWYFPSTERLQKRPYWPIDIFPLFRVNPYHQKTNANGLIECRKSYVVPNARVLEDGTIYRLCG